VQVTTPGATTTTTTAVASSANPVLAGTSVSFTASVAGASPTGTVAFRDNGVTLSGCATVALGGGGNTRTATCTTASLAAGAHTITAAYSGDAGNTASSGTFAETVNAPNGSVNVALASNGGVASASSTYSSAFPASAINDNERAGNGWGAGGGWADGTANVFPDWVQVNFAGQKTIDHVVVYTVQDNYSAPVEPTDTMTFSQWGVTAFDVQAWNGTAWYTVASVTGNNLVKRTVSFAAVTTDRVRITTRAARGAYSGITEVEAWNAP
jgi:hypothetical protein